MESHSMPQPAQDPRPEPVEPQKERKDPEKARRSSSETDSQHTNEAEAIPTANVVPALDGGLRAWMVAAGTAGIYFCTMGYANSFGVFQAYYLSHQLQNETPDRIAWIGSLQNFLIFASGVIGGPLFDRFGAKVLYPASVLYALAVMLTSLCSKYWHFMLCQGVLTGVSQGLVLFPAMSAMPQWFNKKRGAAMGLAIAGSSLGGVVFPIALGKMLNESDIGFGWSIRVCGFIMVPILVFSCLAVKARLPPRKTNFLLPSAFKNVLYDVLVASVFCLLIGMFVPLIFIPTYAIQHGVNPTLASYLVAMLNGASIFGRILPGIAADRVGRLNVLAAMGASTGILVFVWPQVSGTAGIIVFSIFFGFTSGAIVSGATVAISMCPDNLKDMGTWMGQGMAIACLAALVGPPVTGVMLDKYGGYTEVSIFGGVFTLVGAALAVFAKTQTKEGILGRV
ncbi:riboflavin transporter MCH5 [Coniochaeta sp. 2T2.1]|nr:riboflavin transporter MCH5 [Coniochaeta sp. 2T2.1]